MKQTLTIRLAQKQLETLREIATAEDESVSAIIRRMIDDGIKKTKANSRKTKGAP